MSSRKKILIIGGAVAVLAAIVAVSLQANRVDPVRVETGRVERRDHLVSKVSAAGEIKPKEFVELQAEIAGVITDLAVKEGDLVNRGDLLLRIDPTQNEAEARAQRALLEIALNDAASQEAQIALQQSNVQRDEANVRLMEVELERASKAFGIARATFSRRQELYEQNLISQDLYEAARNDLIAAETAVGSSEARLDQARAQLAVTRVVLDQARNAHKSALKRIDQARAGLARAEDWLSKTVIRSPLSGVITQLNVEAGERAVPGTLNNPAATLMIIADLSVIEAEIEVDETDIIEVALEQEAEVKVDALPDTPLKGFVTEIGNSAIQRAGQQEAKDFKVVIQLTDPPRQLRPGLSCTAEILTATRDAALVIPIQALTIREYPVNSEGRILREANGDANGSNGKDDERKEFQGVFRIADDSRVEFVEVETGITGETEIEVKKGLEESAEIVIGSYTALRELKDGDFIRRENQEDD